MLSLVAPSSFIGVAIACTGNVLISLALTVQKLAHRRQELEAVSHSGSPLQSPSATEPSHVDLGDGHGDGFRSGTMSNGVERTHEIGSSKRPGLRSHLPTHYSHDHHQDHSRSRGHSPGAVSPETSHVGEGAYLKSKLWWLGLGMIALGESGNFISYAFAPASVVAPLGTVALIANCVFAPLILGESFTRRNLLGTALAIVGAVTVVWSSRDSNPRLSPDQLLTAIQQTTFIIYIALNVALLVPLIILSSRERWGGRFVGIDIGTCALFGGFTVMSTKALSSLISVMFLAAFKYPIAWGAVIILIVTSVLQIKFLNRALMRFESKEVIPTQFVFFSLSAIIGSAVLYQEFRDIPFTRFVNFAFGIATTFLGVYVLTSPLPLTNPDGDSIASDSSPLSSPGLSLTSPGLSLTSPGLSLSSPQLSLTSPRLGLIPVDETTPLVFPDHRRSSLSDPMAVIRTGGSVPITVHGSVGGGISSVPVRVGKLTKRASSSNVSLGLNSQAGLLLLATTPPVSTGIPGRRERSASRTGAGPGPGSGAGAGTGPGGYGSSNC